MPRIFFLAGEASGDLQAALVARALRRQRPDVELVGVGGEAMAAAGVRLLLSSHELSVVGISEVLSRLRPIVQAYERIHAALAAERPDVFVPVDFPDFNLRLLPRAARLGIPVAWYISPQLWAWRSGRVEQIRRFVERMLVIFPFEVDFYRRHGVEATWVGHPLIDDIPAPSSRAEERRRGRAALGFGEEDEVVALLPGSRRSEIRQVGPVLSDLLAGAPTDTPRRRFLLGRSLSVPPERYDRVGLGRDRVTWIDGGRRALELADFAVAASGTVTVEAALLEVPTVVVYRTSGLTFALARRLVRVPHIAMANLIAGRRLFPELVQEDATAARIAGELERWRGAPDSLAELRGELRALRTALGPPGAAERAASALLELPALRAQPA